VVNIAGDGDFLMTGQELATATGYNGRAAARAELISVVVDNGTYGTIRMHQEREYPRNISGTTLVNPDFCTFARSFGMHAEQVTSAEAFDAALVEALARPSGTLLEIRLSPEVISTRTTLREITQSALQRQAQKAG
jgi:acetolactate synthase-1/2/3 large subunit